MKIIEIENPTEQQLNAFKFQVGTFRKTRHENVVLFMGCLHGPAETCYHHQVTGDWQMISAGIISAIFTAETLAI